MSSQRTRSTLLATVLVASLAACDGGDGPGRVVGPGDGGGGGDTARLGIDGDTSAWETNAGDSGFRKHGVVTGLVLRAKDGERSVELTGTFMGEPTEPVFLAVGVSYDDGQGMVFDSVTGLESDGRGVEGVNWERIAIDHEAGEGRARVALDIPLCTDHYTGPTEYETRCHQLQGRFDVALVHDATLRVMQ